MASPEGTPPRSSSSEKAPADDQQRPPATGPALPEPTDGLAGRMVNETKAIGTDIVELVELRLQKSKIELEETLDAKLNDAAAAAILGVMAGLAGLFILIAASLGLGALLGHPAWGFLIVGLVLGLVGFVVYQSRPHLVSVGSKKARVDDGKLEPNAPKGQPRRERATS